jgi:transposase
LHNAIVRHVVDCEDFSHGDFSFRLNFPLQGWQENLPMSDYFWLREAQFERIKPYFPLSHGVPRVDDRRVVSGIIHVIRNGLRWRDAPEVYGPHKTLYNRFARWSRMGVFARIFSNLVADDEPPFHHVRAEANTAPFGCDGRADPSKGDGRGAKRFES